MSSAQPFPSMSSCQANSNMPPNPSQRMKSQRVLACTLCQQRKVKCDRRFPCANCVKAQAQCIPAVLTRPQRKRRFPERALLDRLRSYEDLLTQNNIAFEPLHKEGATNQDKAGATDNDHDLNDEHSAVGREDVRSPSSTIKSGKSSEVKYALSDIFA